MTPTGAVAGMGDPPAGWHLGLLAMDVVKEKTTETEREMVAAEDGRADGILFVGEGGCATDWE